MRSRSNWNLEVLVFKERAKPAEKPLGPRERTNNKLNPNSIHVDVRIRTRATLVEGECSQHFTTHAPIWMCLLIQLNLHHAASNQSPEILVEKMGT